MLIFAALLLIAAVASHGRVDDSEREMFERDLAARRSAAEAAAERAARDLAAQKALGEQYLAMKSTQVKGHESSDLNGEHARHL